MTFYIRTPYDKSLGRHRMHPFFKGQWPFADSNIFFPVDVKAEDDGFVITASLPGLKPEDINIQIINKNVSLQGEYKKEFEESAKYILQERPGGKFHRTITLSDTLDAAKADAYMENGVLFLRIPKAEESKPKSIKVTVKQ